MGWRLRAHGADPLLPLPPPGAWPGPRSAVLGSGGGGGGSSPGPLHQRGAVRRDPVAEAWAEDAASRGCGHGESRRGAEQTASCRDSRPGLRDSGGERPVSTLPELTAPAAETPVAPAPTLTARCRLASPLQRHWDGTFGAFRSFLSRRILPRRARGSYAVGGERSKTNRTPLW